MSTHERPAKAEASQEEAEHLAKLLQAKFPAPPVSKAPEGYAYGAGHTAGNEELIKAGEFAPLIADTSDVETRHFRTVSGEELALIARRGVTRDPETKELTVRALTRYKGLYPESRAKARDVFTVSTTNGATMPPGVEDEKGFIVDIYDDGQVGVWHGLAVSRPISSPQKGVRWIDSHHRATAQEVFTYYNDIELAREESPSPSQ